MGSPGLKEFCEQHKALLRPTRSSPPTARALQPPRRPFISARAARSTFTSRSSCAKARTTPAIGAGCSPIPASCLRTPSPRSRMPRLHPHFRMAPEYVDALGARARSPICEISGGDERPTIDRGLGRAGPYAAGARLRLVELRSARLHHRQSGATRSTPSPPTRSATCQLRYVVGIDPNDIIPALRRHLDREGFPTVKVEPAREAIFHATRLDPESPWVSGPPHRSSGLREKAGDPAEPRRLAAERGFADILGLPTVWIPHSYAACSQHAPNEHLLAPVAREALAIMAGVYWDLGEK